MIPALLPPATWTLDPAIGDAVDAVTEGVSEIFFLSIMRVVEFRVFFLGVITMRSRKRNQIAW